MTITHTRKRRAPFSAQIDKNSDLVMIYSGSRAWELSKPSDDRVPSLAFPKSVDPLEFDWPVRGKEVVVFSGDESQANTAKLVIELLNSGAEAVHLYEGATGVDDGWSAGAVQCRTYLKPNAQ